METLPFDLKNFPYAAADEKLSSAILSRGQKIWFRGSTISLWVILMAWIAYAGAGFALLFPMLVILWFANIILWQRSGSRARQTARQNAFSSRETYTVRLDDQAITLASPHLRRSYPRDAIREVIDWKAHLLIVVDALSYIAIPPQAFPDTASRARFLTATKAMIPA